MHMRLIAVGDRQPDWVDAAFENYVARLPRAWRFRISVVPTGRRSKSASPQRAVEAEGRKVLDLVRSGDLAIFLDERGREMDSLALSRQLSDWLEAGRNLTFVIGGPDGFSGECLERADFRWSLSMLTLPHGLARIACAEQLYRAWTIIEGHPYHRR